MNISELQDNLTKRNINMPDAEICRIWGMDTSSFSRKKKAGTEIKHHNIQQLEDALKISLIDRDSSTVPVQVLSAKVDKIVRMLGYEDNKEDNTIKLTYRPDVYLSAGYGVEVYNEEAQTITLDSRLLVSERGNKINPKYCEVVCVSGNSMFPEYRHGDRVIIDKSDTELLDGHIYAIRYKNKCFVKEINLLGDKIKCISLNKEYDPFYISEDEEYTVLGRILPRVRL